MMLCSSVSAILFLSTPSARRATFGPFDASKTCDISIHALCEEGDYNGSMFTKSFEISIHALCEEGDVESNKPEE